MVLLCCPTTIVNLLRERERERERERLILHAILVFLYTEKQMVLYFIGLAYQEGKDIVFRFNYRV